MCPHIFHRRSNQIASNESAHTNRIGCQGDVSGFSGRVVENSAAISCGIHIFCARSHIFIHNNCSVIEHLNLTLKQLCIWSKADAHNNEIRVIFSLIRYHLADCAFTFKSNDLFPKRKSNSVTLQGLFNFVRILCIQVFTQDSIFRINERYLLAVQLECFHQFDSDIACTHDDNMIRLLGLFNNRVGMIEVFREQNVIQLNPFKLGNDRPGTCSDNQLVKSILEFLSALQVACTQCFCRSID
ncbi:hypothetical protein D3C76_1170470 [compost metagenome]